MDVKFFPDLYIEENEKLDSILTMFKLMGGRYKFVKLNHTVHCSFYSSNNVRIARLDYRSNGKFSILCFGKHVHTIKDYMYFLNTYMKYVLDGVDYCGRSW